MLPSKSTWQHDRPDEIQMKTLADHHQIPELIAGLLLLRGWTDEQQIKRLLQGQEEPMHDPRELKDMELILNRLADARAKDEHIAVYGDYDADGVCSTALAVHALRDAGHEQVTYYVPDRMTEGYGLNDKALEKLAKAGVTVVLTVDNGIRAIEQAQTAKRLGIDLLITDHHELGDQTPEAYAVVNPKRLDCTYPYPSLAGSGIALKLAQALLKQELPQKYWEIASIGTVADMMPLTGENRTIVIRGIKGMQRTALPGLSALTNSSSIDPQKLDAASIGFLIGPLINACGRMEHADPAIKLLLCETYDEGEVYAAEMQRLNKQRQQVVQQITKQAMAEVASSQAEPGSFLIASGDSWHLGVVGIVAARLAERYARPTLVLQRDAESGILKGSGRTYGTFDLYKALQSAEDLFEHFGGHKAAAGLAFHESRLHELMERMSAAVTAQGEHSGQAILALDGEATLQDIEISTIEQLQALGPFGQQHPTPRFVWRGLQVKDSKTMGKDKNHLRLTLQDDAGATIEAIGFGWTDRAAWIASATSKLDLCGELSINEWNGRRKPQIQIADLHIPHRQVFDFRWVTDPIVAMNKRVQALAEEVINAQPSTIGILINGIWSEVSTESETWFASWLQFAEARKLPVWTCLEDGQAQPLNTFATEADPKHCRDIILADPPEQTKAVHSWWRSVSANWERIYAAFSAATILTVPHRQDFARLYAACMQIAPADSTFGASSEELQAAAKQSDHLTLNWMIRVFEELNFVQRIGQANKVTFRTLHNPDKQPLEQSEQYRKFTAYVNTMKAWTADGEDVFGDKILKWLEQAERSEKIGF